MRRIFVFAMVVVLAVAAAAGVVTWRRAVAARERAVAAERARQAAEEARKHEERKIGGSSSERAVPTNMDPASARREALLETMKKKGTCNIFGVAPSGGSDEELARALASAPDGGIHGTIGDERAPSKPPHDELPAVRAATAPASSLSFPKSR